MFLFCFQVDAQSWPQLGQDIDGEQVDDESGVFTTISADGMTVAIGAQNNDDVSLNTGHVRVYNYDGSSWGQVGADIDGVFAFDVVGSNALNYDGTILAVGSMGSDVTGSNAGQVRIFEFDGSNWIQLGQSLNGEAADDYSGISISLSDNGMIVAIGGHLNDGNGSDAGHVRIYEYDGSNWIQKGMDIDGENSGDVSGYAVSLSSDGLTVAIGLI